IAATRSIPPRSAASSAGRRATISTAGCATPCAGTSSTATGARRCRASATAASGSVSRTHARAPDAARLRRVIRARFTELSRAPASLPKFHRRPDAAAPIPLLSSPRPRALSRDDDGEPMSLPLLQSDSAPAGAPERPTAAGRAPEPRAARAPTLSREVQPDRAPTEADGALARVDYVSLTLYWGIHAAALGAIVWAFVAGVSGTALALFAATFWLRMFGITAGYHRYFSHKSYRTSRAFQTVLAVLGASAVQKGPLWWCGLHRRHHRFSDGPGDIHSPRDGFYYAHQGWVFDKRW